MMHRTGFYRIAQNKLASVFAIVGTLSWQAGKGNTKYHKRWQGSSEKQSRAVWLLEKNWKPVT